MESIIFALLFCTHVILSDIYMCIHMCVSVCVCVKHSKRLTCLQASVSPLVLAPFYRQFTQLIGSEIDLATDNWQLYTDLVG